MDAAAYVAEFGIRSPLLFIRGVRHQDQDLLSDYCIYERRQKKFCIFMHREEPVWELYGMGQVKSHELGFPVLSRIVRRPESNEEKQIFNSSNKALQNFFQHPHVYSIIERFMSPDDWEHYFDRLLGNFEIGIDYYGSVDFGAKKYLAAFAAANMALQLTEFLLSTRRYSERQAARTERCMEAIDRLEDNGIPLRENLWDSAKSTLGPYYGSSPHDYVGNHMDDDFVHMSRLMLPGAIRMDIYTGPTTLTDGKINPVPGLEIPNWLIDYKAFWP